MNRLRNAVAALLLLGCAGCLPIPHRHLQQPEVTFQVQDASGNPVPGATVHLYGGFVVGRVVLFETSARTDTAGRVAFPAKHERHWFYHLVLDSEAPWVWGWCAEAPGFGRAAARMDEPPSRPVGVRLVSEAGAASCAPALQSLYSLPAAS